MLFLLAACCFVTFFSYSTSPAYSGISDNPDSVIFQLIGKYWSEGYVPYQSLWDLKGPYIFLVNAVGYWLVGSRVGVYLLQIVSLTLTLFITYKTLRLSFGECRAMIWTLLALMPLSYVYEGGNLTEEYLLPFLTWSFYYIMRWLSEYERTGDARHRPWWCVTYGVTFALCLFSRLTNALSLSAAIAVIVVVLLVRKKHFANFLMNIACFFAGFLAVCLPFVIYFWSHGALSDMLNSTLTIPFLYALHASQNIFDTGIHHFLLSYLLSIVLLILAVVRVSGERRLTARTGLCLFSSLFPLLWFCQGNGYAHYGMTVFPLFAWVAVELRRHRQIFTVAFLVLTLAGFGSKVRYMGTIKTWENPSVASCRGFLSHVPQVDYTSFVAYNCDPHLYYALGVRPASRYFCLQDFVVSRAPLLRDPVVRSMEDDRVQWILLSYADMPLDQVVIRAVLKSEFVVTKADKALKLVLFRKKTDEYRQKPSF